VTQAIQANEAPRRARQLEGVVRSDKMTKTIVVEVERQTLHPVFKKYVRQSKRYLVHDAEEKAKPGDIVRIEEVRPISARKRYRLLEILTSSSREVIEEEKVS